MSKFSRRLRELRVNRGLSQQKMADAVKLSKSSINMYERGEREPGIETLELFADFFNVDLDYLIGKSDVPNRILLKKRELLNMNEIINSKAPIIGAPMESYGIYGTKPGKLIALDKENVYMIPLFESVSAGFGAQPHSVPVDFVPCYIHSATEASETICIKVTGDSMFPKIEDGDIIQVIKQNYVDSGSVAVIMLDGEETFVKKVIHDHEKIELHSFNPMYPVIRFEGKEMERIMFLGVVKKIIKSI